MVVQTVG
jgi:hypothetical protein